MYAQLSRGASRHVHPKLRTGRAVSSASKSNTKVSFDFLQKLAVALDVNIHQVQVINNGTRDHLAVAKYINHIIDEFQILDVIHAIREDEFEPFIIENVAHYQYLFFGTTDNVSYVGGGSPRSEGTLLVKSIRKKLLLVLLVTMVACTILCGLFEVHVQLQQHIEVINDRFCNSKAIRAELKTTLGINAVDKLVEYVPMLNSVGNSKIFDLLRGGVQSCSQAKHTLADITDIVNTVHTQLQNTILYLTFSKLYRVVTSQDPHFIEERDFKKLLEAIFFVYMNEFRKNPIDFRRVAQAAGLRASGVGKAFGIRL